MWQICLAKQERFERGRLEVWNCTWFFDLGIQFKVILRVGGELGMEVLGEGLIDFNSHPVL
jgi:hypothetical protein